jgi:hypothetical protein
MNGFDANEKSELMMEEHSDEHQLMNSIDLEHHLRSSDPKTKKISRAENCET